MFCVIGLASVWEFFATEYAFYALVTQPGALPGGAWMTWTKEVLTPNIAWELMFFALLLFPNGRLPSPRWRPFAWVAAAVFILLGVLTAFEPGRFPGVRVPNPTGIERAARIIKLIMNVLTFVILGVVLVIAASVIVRFLPVAVAGILVAIGVAILRYRLYEIDIIINRTLVYGSLTVTLVLVYFGGVAAIQAIFRALSSQEHQPQIAVVISTLVIAALFNPLRRHIQSFIDRRFYRRKYDARRTLEAFSARLRDETDLEALSNELVGVVRESMQPAHVSLWLRPEPPSRGSETQEEGI